MSIKSGLREFPLFAELGDPELSMLDAVAEERQYAAGERIIERDDPGTSLFLIRSGRVKVAVSKSDGDPVALTTLGPGDFFGEMSLFDGRRRSASVIAEQDTTAIEINRQRFTEQIRQSPDLALKILGVMADRLRQSDDRVLGLADQVYREAYPRIDKLMQTQLEAARTIYEKTEDRAGRVLNDVERSWQTLTRFISIIVGVITIAGGSLTYLGITSFRDIQAQIEKIDAIEIEAQAKLDGIRRLEQTARDADVTKEIILSIGRIRADLNLDDPPSNPGLDQLRQMSVRFSPAERQLFLDFIQVYDRIQPEVVLEAARTYVDLVTHARYFLTNDQIATLVSALVHVSRQSEDRDWRMHLTVRSTLVALGEGAEQRWRRDVLSSLEALLRYEVNTTVVELNVAMAMAELGSQNAKAAAILLATAQTGYSPWARFNAAVQLLRMGKSQAWKILIDGMQKPGIEGFVAALVLGELGSQELIHLAVQPELGADAPRALFDQIITRMRQGLNDPQTREATNPYTLRYANLIIEELG